MDVLPACMSMYHVHVCNRKILKEGLNPLALEFLILECPSGVKQSAWILRNSSLTTESLSARDLNNKLVKFLYAVFILKTEGLIVKFLGKPTPPRCTVFPSVVLALL